MHFYIMQKGYLLKRSAVKKSESLQKTKEMKRKILRINKLVRRRINETIVEVRSITGVMTDMASETVYQANLMIK